MSLDINPPAPTSTQDRVPTARRRRAPWVVLALLVAVAAGLWVSGVLPRPAWSKTGPALATLAVDRGDLAIVVVENGTLESTNNETVKCRVEALAGQVGGSSGVAGRSGGGVGGMGSAASGGAGSTAGQAVAAPATTKAQGKAATTKTGGTAAGAAGAGTARAGAAGAGAAGAGAAGTGASAGGAAGGGAAGGGAQRPVIRSFTMQVVPHVPLRPQTTLTPQTKAAQVAPQSSGGGGGGGRQGRSSSGSGSGSGSGSDMGMEERLGSTRILSILPEGTRVRAGDVVCELDSAAFRDQLAAQIIRHEQAKAWVEQAKTILEVSGIALREYRDGIYPQDQELIRQYVASCRTEQRRAKSNLDWSREALQKQVRTKSQVRTDELVFEQAEIALREAQGMQQRLERYTAPRLIKSLEAKVEAVRADLLTQQAAFQLEDSRLRRLKTMIDYCTVRAPRDGIVVYASPANRWGRTEDQIREGVTVREGQALFKLPDPKQMCVQVRVNESKVSQIRPGQHAEIRVDAFPNRLMRGTVAEVTPIPAPANGPVSDIKVYFATVIIDSGGFDNLRPGLSAEVTFLVETRPGSIRVPIRAIRWVGDRTFAAQATPAGPLWRPVALGVIGAGYAEVLSGLKPGDRVVTDPDSLPPPSVPHAALANVPSE